VRFPLDALDEARRVLERRQPGRRVVRAARAGPQATRRGHRAGRADDAAQRERAEASP
jgi:hypothetical protein